MSWFSRLFEKADWRLVKEIQAGYIHYQYSKLDPEERINENSYEITYYLYENQFGKRKFDVVDGLLGNIDINSREAKESWTFRSDEYRSTIRPWLDGRHDPDIKSYDQIPVSDFQRRLKGKK